MKKVLFLYFLVPVLFQASNSAQASKTQGRTSKQNRRIAQDAKVDEVKEKQSNDTTSQPENKLKWIPRVSVSYNRQSLEEFNSDLEYSAKAVVAAMEGAVDAPYHKSNDSLGLSAGIAADYKLSETFGIEPEIAYQFVRSELAKASINFKTQEPKFILSLDDRLFYHSLGFRPRFYYVLPSSSESKQYRIFVQPGFGWVWLREKATYKTNPTYLSTLPDTVITAKGQAPYFEGNVGAEAILPNRIRLDATLGYRYLKTKKMKYSKEDSKWDIKKGEVVKSVKSGKDLEYDFSGVQVAFGIGYEF